MLAYPGSQCNPALEWQVCDARLPGHRASPVEGVGTKMERTIASVMETRVVAVDIDDTVEQVLDVLERERLSGVPVLDGAGKCFGVITLTDLRHFHVLKGKPASQRAWEICSHRVIEVPPSESVQSVANAMLQNRVHHVLVCEQGKTLGMVSSFDLLAYCIAAGC